MSCKGGRTIPIPGNDVCTSGADTLAEMTPPDVFYKNTLGTLKFFENKLPPGSHVILIGLIDGSMIWDVMAHRLHPIGQLVRSTQHFENFSD